MRHHYLKQFTRAASTALIVFQLVLYSLLSLTTAQPVAAQDSGLTCFTNWAGSGGISVLAISGLPDSIETNSADITIDMIFTPIRDTDFWADGAAREYGIKSTALVAPGTTVEAAASSGPTPIGDEKYQLKFILPKESFTKLINDEQTGYALYFTANDTPDNERPDCMFASYIVTTNTITCSSETLNKCGAIAGCGPQETCIISNAGLETTEYTCKKLQNECGGYLSCGQESSAPGTTCGCAGSPFEDMGGGMKCCGWVVGGICTSTELGNYERCGTLTPHQNATWCSLPATVEGLEGTVVQSGFSSCTSKPGTCCTEKALCEDTPNVCGSIITKPTGHDTCKIGSVEFPLGDGTGLQRCGDLLVCCGSASSCQAAIQDIETGTGGETTNAEQGSLIDAIKGPTNATFDALNPLNIAAGVTGNTSNPSQSPYFRALSTPGGVVSRVLLFAFPIAGIILFIMIVWGGFEMVTGATNSKSMDAGKQRITAAIIGFILLFISYWLMQMIEMVFGLAIL